MSRSGVTRARLHQRTAAATCGAIAIALAVGACGDDAPEPTPDYPAAADEICVYVAGQLAEARRKEPPPKTPEDAAKLIEVQTPIRLDGLSRLQALRPPPELVAASGQYLGLVGDRIDALDEALAAAKDEDEDAYLAAQERVERLSDKLRAVGEQAGFGACAEVLPPAGQEDVLAAVEKLLTSQDSKKVCRELVTERFAETAFGSVEKCEAERFPTAVSLELLDVGGVGATSAFVDVDVVDFRGTSRQQRIELVFTHDVWKVDHRQALEEPPEKPSNAAGGSAESP